MGWSASLSSTSAVGDSITFTPGTTTEASYVVSSFTAPKKGIYRFTLKGSGGSKGLTSYNSANIAGCNYYQWGAGGTGGKTVGYLLLEKGQTVYVGVGGTCCAAFVSSTSGSKLSAISKGNLYFVAGGGGAGGSFGESTNNSGYNCYGGAGGAGGGSSGGSAAASTNTSAVATGGTQSAGGSGGYSTGAYGTGGERTRGWDSYYRAISGRGGDGYYGGAGGKTYTSNSGKAAEGYGGSGGSGYVKTASLTVNGKTYTSTTTQGGGAEGGGTGHVLWGTTYDSNAEGKAGSVQVTYYARAELPIRYDGNIVERLIFNGTEVTSLVYNGTKVLMERMKRRGRGCLNCCAKS